MILLKQDKYLPGELLLSVFLLQILYIQKEIAQRTQGQNVLQCLAPSISFSLEMLPPYGRNRGWYIHGISSKHTWNPSRSLAKSDFKVRYIALYCSSSLTSYSFRVVLGDRPSDTKIISLFKLKFFSGFSAPPLPSWQTLKIKTGGSASIMCT